jgi:hypothetical protein
VQIGLNRRWRLLFMVWISSRFTEASRLGFWNLHTFGERNSWLLDVGAGFSRRLELRFHSQ